MAQHDMNLADAAGIAFRADLNNALAALVSNSSGATEPATMVAFMWWADTTAGWLKQRNAANSAWINKMPLADAMTAVGASLVSAADAAAARAAIGAVIGADVQAYNANIAKTNEEQTFTAQQVPKNGSLTDGATIDWNGSSNGQVVAVTLAGNRTMNAPTNIKQYALYIMRVSQDATGSRTLAWNAAYKFGGSGAPTLTTTASKTDILSFIGGSGNTLEYLGSRLNAV